MGTVGLTGSIGSGKSTVARLLAERGASVIDADDVTHELQQPGQAVYQSTVERFGPEVLAGDGGLDRAALARMVFADTAALADLESLTHPAVHAAMVDRAATVAGSAPAVVLVVPLLLEVGSYDVAGVLVVDAPVETVIRRLAQRRGMDEGEVRARLARQLPRSQRLAGADFVIDNGGPPEALPPQVDRAWTWIEGLDAGGDGLVGNTVVPPR